MGQDYHYFEGMGESLIALFEVVFIPKGHAQPVQMTNRIVIVYTAQ